MNTHKNTHTNKDTLIKAHTNEDRNAQQNEQTNKKMATDARQSCLATKLPHPSSLNPAA
jgi:hypothetical protein